MGVIRVGNPNLRVYWANSFFNEADSAFNSRAAEALRRAGLYVFLPQEEVINDPGAFPGFTSKD